jgi:hypothetical protein
MFKRVLSALLSPGAVDAGNERVHVAEPPDAVEVAGRRFVVAECLSYTEGLPHLDWNAVSEWVAAFPDDAQRDHAWGLCERAWLDHLRAALGAGHKVRESGTTLLLCSLEERTAKAALDFVAQTEQRVLRVLDGIATSGGWGHDIVVLFDDQETYYRYVSHHYPHAGEFALSGGMFIHAGCAHFVAVKGELHALEPVIAHETTHALLSHLPIPAWLNEGLAVNTEHRLCPAAHDPRSRPSAMQMHLRHKAFWGPHEMQQFWSGQSFLRSDQGNELSYDFARILVEQFAADWEPFVRFACSARLDDAGAQAAEQELRIDLGEAVAAVLERPSAEGLAPLPQAWAAAPERGGFSGATSGSTHFALARRHD